MFKYTIDSKSEYTNEDNNVLIDFTRSIFSVQAENNTVYTMYKIPKDMEMRADKASVASYGSDDYTEMVLKFMLQDNPFAVEMGDIVLIPSLTSMYNDVIDVPDKDDSGTTYDFVKNYHKYIDESKLPAFTGSQDSNTNKKSSGSKSNLLNSNTGGENQASGQGSGDTVSQESSYITNSPKSARAGRSNNLYNVYGSGSDDVNTQNMSRKSTSSLSNSDVDYSGSSLLANSGSAGVGAIYGAGNTSNLGYGIDDDDMLGITDMNTNNDNSNQGNQGLVDVEANLSNNGESGIKIVNGKIYFGDNVYSNPNDITDVRGTNKVDSDLVDCARNGVTLGQFLDATIRNSVKNSNK